LTGLLVLTKSVAHAAGVKEEKDRHGVTIFASISIRLGKFKFRDTARALAHFIESG